MTNDKNPFKSIEEKFLEKQRAKQAQGESKVAGTIPPTNKPIEVKKFAKLAIYLRLSLLLQLYWLLMCSL